MRPVLSLDDLKLSSKGEGLTAALHEGGSMCVLGTAGSGKSRLLEIMAGSGKPHGGAAHVRGGASITRVATDRKATANSLSRAAAGSSPGRAAEALHALGLWDHRSEPVSKLGPTRLAASRLAEALSFHTRLFLIDSQLDLLDPWTLESAWQLIERRLGEGSAVVVATNRPELALRFERIVVLDSLRVRYQGTVADLLRSHGPAQIEVETTSPARARAVVDPLQVSMERTEKGLLMRSHEGQELAARLLVHGYGDVRSVLVREPTVAEALQALS